MLRAPLKLLTHAGRSRKQEAAKLTGAAAGSSTIK